MKVLVKNSNSNCKQEFAVNMKVMNDVLNCELGNGRKQSCAQEAFRIIFALLTAKPYIYMYFPPI